MKTTRIEIVPALDHQGELEEFTWDLVPLVPAEKTLHLQRTGLPKIGVYIPPGGILIGKIGKSKNYRSDNLPSSLELHGLEFDALKFKFGNLWYDASVYATTENAGVVSDAHFETKENRLMAVVMIDSSPTISGVQAVVPELSAAARTGKASV